MQFPNYDAFRVGFMQLADGDDVSQASFSPTTADLIIAMGETRVYSDLRAATMVSPLSLTPTAGVYTLPADLIELKEVYFDGDEPLEIVPLDKYRKLIAAGASSGQARYAAQDGDTLLCWPESTATLLGSYYARPEALKTITWADATTFARYPECFLFAALMESTPFLGDGKYQVWERKYSQFLDLARHNERMRVYGGSPLRVRAR